MHNGNFYQNNYFFKFYEENKKDPQQHVLNQFIGYINFEGPYNIPNSINQSELIGIIHQDTLMDIIEINFINLKNNFLAYNKLCKWIINQISEEKLYFLIKFSREDDVWLIDCYDTNDLKHKIRIYISYHFLSGTKLCKILEGFKRIIEKITLIAKSFQYLDLGINSIFEELGKLEINYCDFQIQKISLNNFIISNREIKNFFSNKYLKDIKKLKMKKCSLNDDSLKELFQSTLAFNIQVLSFNSCYHISNTTIHNMISCSSLQNLLILDLGGTQINDESLILLMNCSYTNRITKLNISDCLNISDFGIKNFLSSKKMKDLTKLYISWTFISTFTLIQFFENDIEDYKFLFKIKCAQCKIFSEKISKISIDKVKFPLKKIDLSKTEINEENLNLICNSMNIITNLSVANCLNLNLSFQDKIKDLFFMKNLKKLDLSNTQINASFLEQISIKLFLKKLKLNGCKFLTNLSILKLLKNMKTLKTLHLKFTKINDELFETMNNEKVKPSNLYKLFLNGCKITDLSVKIIFTEVLIPYLKYFCLAETEITDKSILCIASQLVSVKLYELDVSGCKNLTNNSIEILLHGFDNSFLHKINFSNTNINDNIYRNKLLHQVKMKSSFKMKNCDNLSSEGHHYYKKANLLSRSYNHGNKKEQKEENSEEIVNDFYFSKEMLNLQSLNFNASNITDTNVSNLCKSIYLNNIETMNLSLTKITDESMNSIAMCNKLLKLQNLNLSQCRSLTDKAVNFLINSKFINCIKVLNLSFTNISDNSLFMISISKNFKQLIEIDISDCKLISDLGMTHLLKSLYLKLEKLNASSTNLTDNALKFIKNEIGLGKLKCLKEIRLNFCKNIRENLIDEINNNSHIIIFS